MARKARAKKKPKLTDLFEGLTETLENFPKQVKDLVNRKVLNTKQAEELVNAVNRQMQGTIYGKADVEKIKKILDFVKALHSARLDFVEFRKNIADFPIKKNLESVAEEKRDEILSVFTKSFEIKEDIIEELERFFALVDTWKTILPLQEVEDIIKVTGETSLLEEARNLMKEKQMPLKAAVLYVIRKELGLVK